MTTPLQTRRGTPRDTTEGLDQDICRSDHSDPYHTTLELSSRVSEPKGGIDALKESSPSDFVGTGATPANPPSARRPAGSLPTKVAFTPMGLGLTVAAIRSFAVNSQPRMRGARNNDTNQQNLDEHQTRLGACRNLPRTSVYHLHHRLCWPPQGSHQHQCRYCSQAPWPPHGSRQCLLHWQPQQQIRHAERLL